MSERIALGYSLDLLLNRSCKLENYEKNLINGSILLPDFNDPGTGNIVIRGKPGTGKSTLALEIAVASANQAAICNNENARGYSSIYFSMEVPPEHILNRAAQFGWRDHVKLLSTLNPINEFSSPQEYGLLLHHIFTQPDSHSPASKIDLANEQHPDVQEIKPKVLIPYLSPRNVCANGTLDLLFIERFLQLERILIGADWLKANKLNVPELRLVCIDSLNVFGDQPLTREQVYRLFDLFKRFQVIGVFIMEEDQNLFDSSSSIVDADIIDYIGDVVISLSGADDNGYFMRYFEICKSRFQHQIYGKHPFRIIEKPTRNSKTAGSGVQVNKNGNTERQIEDAQKPASSSEQGNSFNESKAKKANPCSLGSKAGIAIYPSLHYLVLQTGKFKPNHKAAVPFSSHIGIENLLVQGKKRPIVMLIEGARGTYKIVLAQNLLLEAIYSNNGKDNVLLIRLNDVEKFTNSKPFRTNSYFSIDWRKEWILDKHDHSAKVHINEWRYKESIFTEMIFRSGQISAEEFIQTIREYLLKSNNEGRRITRVAIGDIGLIGVSYPFLRNSRTSGDLFMTTFVHIMRNYGIDLIMTGTSGQLEESDKVVNRARELADMVISSKICDVFGDRYAILSGESITSPEIADEIVPGVIIKLKDNKFTVNYSLLKGLVGFQEGKIHRPGFLLYLFQEGHLHKRYNKSIAQLIGSSFGIPPDINTDRQFNIRPFTSKSSEAIHDSIGLLEGSPLDKTIVCTFDEFFYGESGDKLLPLKAARIDPKQVIVPIKGTPAQYCRPYYANVLLLAYRKDECLTTSNILNMLEGNNHKVHAKPESWQSVLKVAEQIASKLNEACQEDRNSCRYSAFDYDAYAAETMSCLLIDSVIAAYKLKHRQQERYPDSEMKSRYASKKRSNANQIGEIVDHAKDFQAELEKELYAIRKLFTNSPKYLAPSSHGLHFERDCGIYLIWYSQLRSFLDTNPDLIDKIDICPLPGNGFRGDWYAGILKGSVSAFLGSKIIEMVCDEKEDYKRFEVGVGLPVQKKYYSGAYPDTFSAWPGAKRGINLIKILSIHRAASSRADIPYYARYRNALASIGKQLAKTEVKDKDEVEYVHFLCNKMLAQLEIFRQRT